MKTAVNNLLYELRIISKQSIIDLTKNGAIERALKEEKKQIIDAYSDGYSDGVQEPNPNDEYYNQTYNQNK